MKYSLKIIQNKVVISADRYGRYETFEELKKEILHFKKNYDEIILNNLSGPTVCFDTLSDLELIKLIGTPIIKNCHNCGEQLEEGLCYTKNDWKGFLLYGLSYKKLVFENGNGEYLTILENDMAMPALKCMKCLTLLIEYKVSKL